jgi:hypothetical protein
MAGFDKCRLGAHNNFLLEGFHAYAVVLHSGGERIMLCLKCDGGFVCNFASLVSLGPGLGWSLVDEPRAGSGMAEGQIPHNLRPTRLSASPSNSTSALSGAGE